MEAPPTPPSLRDQIRELRTTVPALRNCRNELIDTMFRLDAVMASNNVPMVSAAPMARCRVNLQRAIDTLTVRINMLQQQISDFDEAQGL